MFGYHSGMNEPFIMRKWNVVIEEAEDSTGKNTMGSELPKYLQENNCKSIH